MPVNQQDDLEALSRRYWAAWSDALRAAAAAGSGATGMPGMPDFAGMAGFGVPGGVPGMGAGVGMAGFPGMGAVPGMGGLPGMGAASGAPGWREAIDWWTKIAQGGGGQSDDTLERFNTQARQWYGQMQEVAARFAGQDASAADVARAWKDALGGGGASPFPDMLRSLRGHGLGGMDQWVEGAAPWMQSMHGQADALLRTPTFGFAREHQERAQALARAQLDYQQATAAYNALMMKASQDAFAIFESRLAGHEEPGRQVTSARALFDVWIDAAEEAYARVALSTEFREVYGRMVNAQMRLRGCVQRAVEDACAQLGMPTRSELDGAHRKLAQLEREVRRLRDAVAQGQGGRASAPVNTPKAANSGTAARESAMPATTTARPAAKRATKKATKTAVRKAVPAPVKVKKAPAKKAAGKATKKASKKAATKAAGKAAGKAAKPASTPRAKRAATATPRTSRSVATRTSRTSRAKAEGFGSVIANAIPKAPRPLKPSKKSPAARKR